MKDKLIKAIDLALAGEWNSAHAIVQQIDRSETAAWIHAVLHKIEGDAGNSRYWYAIAHKENYFPKDPATELQEIKQSLSY